ncbi:hypothetical protein AbraIFM66950_000093 [Aspergillus brasiliensis]|nr:hypothetical protein AbraIFM66950_000093 [Aspergillus brasiliensis]
MSSDISDVPEPGEAAVYIAKEDSRNAQHAESTIYGGQNPRGGIAAQMQSAADKIEHAHQD